MPKIFEYHQVTSLVPGLFVISPIRFPISICIPVKYNLQFSGFLKKSLSDPVKASQSKRFVQKPAEEIRVDRLSRHLYDVEKLMQTEFIDLALDNPSLYNEIINHRSVYTKIATIDYNLHQPKTLNPIPPDKILGDWEKDYKFMQEAMIYGESLPFEKLIEKIKELKQRINGITWTE